MGTARALKAAAALILIIFFSSAVYAQEITPDLLAESRAAEIELSDYQELRVLSARLGLDASGTEEQMRDALYAYYGLDADTTLITEGEQDSLRIRLNYAESADYGEQTLFYGSVELEIEQPGGEQRQHLTADAVILHRESRRIAAVGNVTISDERGGQVQQFTADSFVLNFQGTDGMFITAQTRSDRTSSSGEAVEFYLTGKTLEIDDRTMILTDSFLSSRPDDPYYSLRAQRMKVLGSGDWFLTHGLLNLGRVPVFYLPFFFYPAETFFFNPSFGIDSSRGLFFNSTTMLFGSKKLQDTGGERSFSSFLQMRDTDESPYTQREGLLLASSPEPPGPLESWAADSGSYAALHLDVYQENGLYMASDLKLQELSFTDSFTWFAGISRDTDSIGYVSEPELSFSLGPLDFSARMPWYAEPDIYGEFISRNTSFSFNALFGGENFAVRPGQKNTFSWEADASGTVPIESFGSYVDHIEVSRLKASVEWGDYDTIYHKRQITYADTLIRVGGTLYEHTPKEVSEPESTDIVYDLNSPEGQYAPRADQDTVNPGPFSLKGSDTLAASYYAGKPAAGDFQAKLSYQVTEQFSRKRFFEQQEFHYDEMRTITSPAFTFSSTLPWDNIGVKHQIKPVLTTLSRDDGDANQINEQQQEITLLSDLTLSADTAGLTYENRYYLYHEELEEKFIRHRLSASQKLPAGQGSLTLSGSAVLPPLSVRLEPKLLYRYDLFSASLEVPVVQTESGSWENSTAAAAVEYTWSKTDYIKAAGDIDTRHPESSDLTLSASSMVYDMVQVSGTSEFSFDPVSFTGGRSRLLYDDISLTMDFDLDPDKPEARFARISGWQLRSGDIETERNFWKRRITVKAGFNGSWYQNLFDAYDNALDVQFKLQLSIAEFLDVNFLSRTRNTRMNDYFGSAGSRENLFTDLLKSFNFFSRSDRLDSNFNLDSIQIGIVHYMRDWDLHADVTGAVGYDNVDEQWKWQPEVTVYLQWKAIPELEFETTVDEDGQLRVQ